MIPPPCLEQNYLHPGVPRLLTYEAFTTSGLNTSRTPEKEKSVLYIKEGVFFFLPLEFFLSFIIWLTTVFYGYIRIYHENHDLNHTYILSHFHMSEVQLAQHGHQSHQAKLQVQASWVLTWCSGRESISMLVRLFATFSFVWL